MLGIVTAFTAGVVALSLALPPTYEASLRILVNPPSNVVATADADTVVRELATLQKLLGTREVLGSAARRLPGETIESLEEKVTASVDAGGNLMSIVARDRRPEHAAEVANVVAAAFHQRQVVIERQQYQTAITALTDEIARLRAAPATDDAEGQIRALQTRLAELTVDEASAGADVQVAEAAVAPRSPSSPKPLRNGIVAFFAAIVLAIMVALARDQLQPRFSSERELSNFLTIPVIASVPLVRTGFPRSSTRTREQLEHDRYETLAASLRLALPPARARIIMVTSGVHGEGKTTVTHSLGMGLARAGHGTLVVSGDLRYPELDARLGVEGDPGWSDLLTGAGDMLSTKSNGRARAINGGSPGDAPTGLAALITPARDGADGELDVLPAGRRLSEAVRRLEPDVLAPAFKALRRLAYTYILIDTPPLLGVADTQVLARFCDTLLVVARLDRTTSAIAVDVRDAVQRLAIKPLGLVVLGGRTDPHPWFVSRGHVRGEQPEQVEFASLR
jgi:capsular polysaccharide biosynthesis protein/MinD-like ATPase involved in chromosome partitioning or flagellar assembly